MTSIIIAWGLFLGVLFYLKDEDKMAAAGAILLAIVTLGNAALFFF